jgi:hypothetical protein
MAAVNRWFVRCTTCLAVSAVNESPNTGDWKCGICGGGFESMGRVERDRLIHEHEQAICDDRCTNARGPICNCKCGGQHHGSKRVVRVVRDAGPVPTVTPASGRDQARLNAEEYRGYRAAVLAELDPLLEQRRAGWLETPRYDRMRNLQAAIRKAAEARDHSARMRALRAVVPIQSSPIADLARAIEAAPKVAEAPFTLTATAGRREQPKQTSLF